MGELLLEEGRNAALDGWVGGDGMGTSVRAGNGGIDDGKWSVERRFRVTEVFLAVLWVWVTFFMLLGEWRN
jgi:hypothetical protein